MVIHRSAPFVVSTESGSRMRLLGEGWLLFVGGTARSELQYQPTNEHLVSNILNEAKPIYLGRNSLGRELNSFHVSLRNRGRNQITTIKDYNTKTKLKRILLLVLQNIF